MLLHIYRKFRTPAWHCVLPQGFRRAVLCTFLPGQVLLLPEELWSVAAITKRDEIPRKSILSAPR